MSSSSMPWVKMYTEMLNDPKLFLLSDAVKLRFIQFILLAGECDAEGYLVSGDTPLSLEYMAHRLIVEINQLKAETEVLIGAGLLKFDGMAYIVINFSKRQGRSQEEKRYQWKERQQRHRAKDDTPDENDECHAYVTSDTSVTNPPVTPLEEEEEEDKEKRLLSPGGDAGGEISHSTNGKKPKIEVPKPKTEDVLRMERLEAIFAQERGCEPPDWTNPKAANKRWRTPLREILKLCRGDEQRAGRVVALTVQRMIAGNLTFDAPDQILKSAGSLLADLNSGKVKDAGLKLTETERVRQFLASFTPLEGATT